MNHAALVRVDIDLDAATVRRPTAAELEAFKRGRDVHIVRDASAATVRPVDAAEVARLKRGHVPAGGRWLTFVRAFPPEQFDVQLGLDEPGSIALAEALGELAGRAWREGRFQP